MTRPKIMEILKELRFSSGLSDEDMGKLAEIATLVEFPAGTMIFQEGSAVGKLYLLRTGRVQLSMNVPPRGSLPILTLGDGDLLGWTPVLVNGQMTATAIALADTQTIQLNANQLHSLCEQDHDIGYEIMRRIAISLFKRLIATRLQVLDLFADSPQDSYSSFSERT